MLKDAKELKNATNEERRKEAPEIAIRIVEWKQSHKKVHYRANRLAGVYLLCKVMNILNCLGHLWFMKRFVQADGNFWAVEVIEYF
jgi:hypothetical protein